MRRPAAVALPLCLVLGLVPRAWALSDTRLAWGRHDTNLHLTAAFAGSLAGTELLRWAGWSKPRAVLGASLAVVGAGLLKEFVIDGDASGSDLMADGIGIGGQALFQFTVRFDWPWSKPSSEAERPARAAARSGGGAGP
ncbi:MAG: hypothetical protein HY924_04065 [Elusimicrobia bacterium]|nr:hypothetical protein [Elusimicrobiota bacterium]